MRVDPADRQVSLTVKMREGRQFLVRSISAPPGLQYPLEIGQPFSARLLSRFLESVGIPRDRWRVEKHPGEDPPLVDVLIPSPSP